MNRKNLIPLRLAVALLATVSAWQARAQVNGTWITAGTGTYSVTTNWQGGTVAGSGGTADFNTVDITGTATVTVDAATNLSGLTFGDTATATAGTWALGGAGGLTLAGATITTNVNTSFNSGLVISGNGYTKAGSGQLTFNTAAATNTLNGAISLNGGTLAVRGNSSIGAGAITMANGTNLRLENNGGTGGFISNAVSLATGANVTFSSTSAGNGFSGLVTGDATAKITIANSLNQAFSLGNTGTANAQLANFQGTVDVPAGAALRFSSTSGPNGNGGTNTTFNIDGNVFTRNTGGANGVVFGALTGSGSLSGQTNTAAGDVAYVIGSKNIDALFSGTIVSGANGTASIRKVGTGTQSFNGSMASNGTITVNAGTANFADGFSKTGTGAITVNTGGTLAGTASSLTGNLTVNSGGALRPNSLPVNVGERLTFVNNINLAAGSNTQFDFQTDAFTGVDVGGTSTLAGLLTLNFLDAVSAGTYDLFSFASAPTSSITGVTLSGFYSGSLAGTSGTWTLTSGSRLFSYVESTGDLTVSVVPEPATVAALAGAAALGFAAWRRRRS